MKHWVVTGGIKRDPELTYKLARSDNAVVIKRFELTLRIRDVTYTHRTSRPKVGNQMTRAKRICRKS